MFSLTKILPLLSLSILGQCLTPAQWRQESIYQVITDRFARTDGSTTAGCNINDYCGGTWAGLIKKLDYIQGMGFTAVWISPVVKNIEGLTSDGSSYHGYWAQDINSLNPHFGTASDLKALSSALHSRGMHLMVDIVTNHMGYVGCGNCVDYSTLSPFNSASYYHPFCFIDYNNAQSITNCWEGSNTVSLPDLRTENSNVQSVFNSWIAKLVSDYSIDGLRVDSMQQVNAGFWKPFQAAAGGIHAIGEVFNGDPAYTCPYQGQLSGVMNYPTFYTITNAFRSTNGDIQSLVNGINRMKSTCSDVTLLGSFLENHDNPRFPSLTSDVSLIKNAIGFTLLADGTPIIYQGQEQQFRGADVPTNREALWLSGYNTGSTLYQYIKTLNALRSLAIKKDPKYLTYNAWPIQSDSRTIVMRKGFTNNQVISIWTNRGANSGSAGITVGGGNAGWGAGWYMTDVLSCKTYVADSNGNIAVTLSDGLPQVLFPSQALNGSGICGK